MKSSAAERILVVIRRDQAEALKRAARERDRSKMVREALDRYLNIVPDAEIPPPSIYSIK